MEITQEQLMTAKDHLTYDKDTGDFTWIKKPSPRTNVHVGTVAGTITGSRTRYRYITINGQKMPAHRLAWAFCYGPFEGMIDHINGDTTDNRIENLRPTTRSLNACNAVRANNTSGFKNVFWIKRISKWHVKVRAEGRRISLGYYDDKDEAIRVAKEAMDKYHGEFARY